MASVFSFRKHQITLVIIVAIAVVSKSIVTDLSRDYKITINNFWDIVLYLAFCVLYIGMYICYMVIKRVYQKSKLETKGTGNNPL